MASPQTMKDLVHHQLVGAEESLLRVDAYKWFTEEYPSENFVCSASDMRAITSLCAQNLGISVLPSNYSDHNLVKLFKVKPEIRIGLWILTHPDLRHVVRIRAFSDFLYEYMSKQEF